MYFVFLIILVVITISPIQSTIDQKASTYTAVAPKIIYPYSTFNISITVEEGGSPTLFIATLSASGKSYTSTEIEVIAGMAGIISLEVNDLPDENYKLQIRSDTSGITNTEETTVFTDRKERVIIIHTDKPVYKPGQTVRFRVLVLTRTLKPYVEPQRITVRIVDPFLNIVKSWEKIKVLHGLVSLNMELTPETNLGNWSVKVVSDENVIKETFIVAEYVLPKFQVKVNVPKFVTIFDSKLRVHVKAEYTYGKKVKGECTVNLARPGLYYDPKSKEVRHLISKHIQRFNGEAWVEFNIVKDFGLSRNFGPQFKDFYEDAFLIEATVKDKLTSREHNSSVNINVYKLPYKVEYIDKAISYQPGLPLVMRFKVSTQDDVPIEDPSPVAIRVFHGFSYYKEDSTMYSAIPSTGIVEFTFNTPSNEYISVHTMDVTYKEFRSQFFLPPKMKSISKIYIQITIPTPNVKGGEEVKVNLRSNQELKTYSYILCARGLIMNAGSTTLAVPTKNHYFNMMIPIDAAPQGFLVVYSLFGEKHEVVSHSLQFYIGTILPNSLDLELSGDTFEPGENLTISMRTAPKSIVALRGIDQSALLLKDDKDINAARMEQEFKSIENVRSEKHRMWGGSGSFQIFETAGLVIMTNGELEKVNYYPAWHEPVMFKGFEFGGRGGRYNSNPVKKQISKEEQAEALADYLERAYIPPPDYSMPGGTLEVRVRKNFPETWLWEEVWVEEGKNSTTIAKTVPDTLTSWIITGYSLNSEIGMGISLQPLTLRTFRPFFISLNLPYAVVKGEIVSLQILVHNYLTEKINVTVTLSKDDEKFKFWSSNKNHTKVKNMTKKVSVSPSEVTSVPFIIVPNVIGIIMINVQARSDWAGDAVSRPLTIKPPGHKQSKNRAVLIDLRSQNTSKFDLLALFPKKRVKGADTVKFSVLGDLLGSTITNLGNLLTLPCGCGEQNMLNFVPDVVILDYLTITKRLTPSVKFRALKFLESGYQRQLTYSRYDGSFSAFGKSDAFGSTWLTAFVVRSFVAAMPYIKIDERVINQALQFLVSRQSADGSFYDIGRILHTDLQSESSDGYAMTAYTLLAFLEAGGNSTTDIEFTYSMQLKQGLNFLAKGEKKVHDMYSLVLIAYTLEVANHPAKDKFFKIIAKAVIITGDMMHWRNTIINKDALLPFIIKPEAVNPVAVEITAYALMTYLHRNKLEESVRIGKWLLRQRTAEGGFLSTQDTIVGLTAMAKFAMATFATNINLTVKASYKGGRQVIRVNKNNAIETQEFQLPANTRNVRFEVSGTGTALAQLTWTYYSDEPSSKPGFQINVDATLSSLSLRLKLNICARYIAGHSSNMAVIDVNVPSGYTFDREKLTDLRAVKGMKKYELEEAETKLYIYFDTLKLTKTCLSVEALRIFPVGKKAPAYVLVYDYYDITKKARAFYKEPEIKHCPLCDWRAEQECDIVSCLS